MSVICPPEVDTPLLQEELKTIPKKAKRIKTISGKLTPETIAKAIEKAIVKNTFMIVPGFMSKTSWLLHRLLNGYGTRLLTDLIIRFYRDEKR